MKTEQLLLQKMTQLEGYLQGFERCTIAVSGGIDSMVLSWIANRCLGNNALIVHATSPAVSQTEGDRVRDYADRCRWNYQEIIATQMEQETYQSNPLNRCYYCKSGLYCQLSALAYGQVMTGTNMDDLGDFRPGLIAAQEQGVRHPYVECQINKATIRKIAAYFQLTDLQDLPASPCLSSRIETGIRINNEQLSLIDRVETYLRQHLPGETVRLRIRHDGLVVELHADTLNKLSPQDKQNYVGWVESTARNSGIDALVRFAPYQQGSAFVGDKTGRVQI
ncbi:MULTISPECIES: hypothetical protein [Enterobacterales]|uniref:hypothetical protein n=1 Tax=Enterobacterales TaxID=91347 RepID=UPI002ED99002